MGPELLQRKLPLRVPTVGLPSSDLSLSKRYKAKRAQELTEFKHKEIKRRGHGTPQYGFFSSSLNRLLLRGFYVVKNSFVKSSWSINEGFPTIGRSTIEGFQCT